MGATIEITDTTYERLQELASLSGRLTSEIAEEAVRDLRLAWVGDDDAEPLHTPFKKLHSDRDADAVLRQRDPTHFRSEEAFRYLRLGQPDFVVPRGDATDLASVPTMLTWLVPRYGRHTLPALLHDHLVEPTMDPKEREQADITFRNAMGGTKVPLVRRWVMWTAVTIPTLLRRPPWNILLAVWLAFYLLAGVDLFLAAAGWARIPAVSEVPWPVVVASPPVAAVVWVKRYRFGVISAYSLMVLPASMISVALTGLLYSAAEGLGLVVLHLMRTTGRDVSINPVRVSKL